VIVASELFRIAAIGDLHLTGNDGSEPQWVRELFAKAAAQANVIVLCGDLTSHGTPAELRPLLKAISNLDIPIVAVLGNHDYEADREDELQDVLEGEGVSVLDGSAVEIDGVGFAGVKGAGGGFGRHTVQSFGEPSIRSFMQETRREVQKLEVALDALASPVKVVLMHYAPIEGTLHGEPQEIWPFLGHSGFWGPIRAAGASVVFHGHAHLGSVLATHENIPVFNVARPVLQRHNLEVRIWSKRWIDQPALA
jgi:Icc-related predicted phosphoesterase